MEIRNKITGVAVGAVASVGLLTGAAALAGAQTPPDTTTDPGVTAPADAAQDTTEEQDPALNGSITAPEDESLSEAEENAGLSDLATISAAEAEQAAADAVGGTAGTTQLENENGSVVYEVDVTDASGGVTEVKVDAGNGAVLDQEMDNEADEANEGPEDNEATSPAPAN